MRKLLYIAFFLNITGCASLLSSSEYPVVITSPVEGTAFEIVNRDVENVFSGVTPKNVALKSKAGYFRAAKYKVNYENGNAVELNANVSSAYMGNLFFGWILGWFVIDPATGAMWNLPDHVGDDPEGIYRLEDQKKTEKIKRLADEDDEDD